MSRTGTELALSGTRSFAEACKELNMESLKAARDLGKLKEQLGWKTAPRKPPTKMEQYKAMRSRAKAGLPRKKQHKVNRDGE